VTYLPLPGNVTSTICCERPRRSAAGGRCGYRKCHECGNGRPHRRPYHWLAGSLLDRVPQPPPLSCFGTVAAYAFAECRRRGNTHQSGCHRTSDHPAVRHPLTASTPNMQGKRASQAALGHATGGRSRISTGRRRHRAGSHRRGAARIRRRPSRLRSRAAEPPQATRSSWSSASRWLVSRPAGRVVPSLQPISCAV
jgi:hypothetical protein